MALRKKSHTYAFSMSQLLYAQAIGMPNQLRSGNSFKGRFCRRAVGPPFWDSSQEILRLRLSSSSLSERRSRCVQLGVVFVFAIIRSYRSSSALTPPWPLIFLSFALLLSTAHRPTLFLILLASLTTSTTEVKNSEQLLFNNLNNFHRCRSRYSLQRDWSPHSICT